MSGGGFDRVRPRSPRRTSYPMPSGLDAEGKRALFTAASEVHQPGIGSALVECSRCQERTVLSPLQAMRVSLPSLHLALRVGHGEEVHEVNPSRRDYPSYLRCPACGRPSWVRFTVQV